MNWLNTFSSFWLFSGSNSPNNGDVRPYGELWYRQETSTNKTIYEFKMFIQVVQISSGGNHLSIANYNFNSNINGTPKNYSGSVDISGVPSWGTLYIGSQTYEINNNTDGTGVQISYSLNGSCSVYVSDEYGLGDWFSSPTRGSYTYYYTPPTIPRISSITNNTSTSSRKEFGDTSATDVTFSISRYDSAFTHTLKYTVSGTTTTIDTGIATSKSYTFPTSLISNFPSSAEPTITVICETYNGSTLIGSSNTTVYLKVPDSYVPTCSLALSDDNSITSTWGIWVKSQSILKGTITASGVSGSTISSYLSTLEGENKSGTPFTKTLQTSGSVEITSKATDTRGRTASDSETITVVDYTPPTLVSIAVRRCTSDGTLDEFGTYGKVVCEYSISSCSDNNAKSLVVNLGATVKTFTLSSYSGTYTATDLFSGLAIDTTYNLTFKLIDSFYDASTTEKTVSQVYSVLPSFVLESDHNGGDGKCLGRVATRSGFDVYLDSTFFGELKKGVADEEDEYKVLDTSDITQTITDDVDKVPSANAVKDAIGHSLGFIGNQYITGTTSALASGTNINWSDSAFSGSNKGLDKVGLKKDLITSSSGAVLYTHDGTISFIEVEIFITGYAGGNGGVWWGKNGNVLNGAILLLPHGHATANNVLSHIANSTYGSASNKYIFDVSNMEIGASFFINPNMQIYGASFTPNDGGTKSFMTVKGYM